MDYEYRPSQRVLGIPNDYKKEGYRMYNDIAKHYAAVSIAQLSLGFGKQALLQYGEYISPSAIPLEIREDSCDSGLKIYEGFTFPAPRELIADPEWPNKVRTGNEHMITRCIHCNTCLVSLFSDFHVRCAVNPSAEWERFDPEYWPPPRMPIQPVKWQ